MNGKTFWITGCASGIGRELALRLIGEGASVWAVDIHRAGLDELETAVGSARLRTERVDVTDAAGVARSFEAAIAAFGHVDVCMNVAGYLRPAWVVDASDEDVARHIDINVKGVIHGTRAAATHMLARGSGHIINFASLAGIAGIPGIALYSASKFAVRGFSHAADQELRRRGVAVTVVCPDAVQTPMLDLQRDYPEAALTFSGNRTLTVGDVCDAVLGSVLRRRPVEITIPTSRGSLATVASAFPSLAALIEPVLRRKGQRRQGSSG